MYNGQQQQSYPVFWSFRRCPYAMRARLQSMPANAGFICVKSGYVTSRKNLFLRHQRQRYQSWCYQMGM